MRLITNIPTTTYRLRVRTHSCRTTRRVYRVTAQLDGHESFEFSSGGVWLPLASIPRDLPEIPEEHAFTLISRGQKAGIS